jgi:hypothetical protein
MPDFAFPTVGPVDTGSPPSQLTPANLRYYAQLRLPNTLLGSFAIRYLPDTLLCPSFYVCVSPYKGDSIQRRGFLLIAGILSSDRISCYLLFSTRKYLALPGSWVAPLSSCPVLRPRWYHIYSPLRIRGCCLPKTSTWSAFINT